MPARGRNKVLGAGAESGPDPGLGWLPAQAAVLLVSASTVLQGEVGRVSAAAAVDLVIAESWDHVAGRWDGIAAILVGADAAGGTATGWPGPTMVVGFGTESDQLWAAASRLGADRVAVLPAAAHWLAGYLARLRDPASGGTVIGVMGGCGGAGASTLAVLLAGAAAAGGTRTLLVDGDEWGGGLDLALAADGALGLRWPDVLNATGAINPGQLAASLPIVAGMSLLSWGSRPAASADVTASRLAVAGAEVLRAARQAYAVVVVDLGRSRDAIDALGMHCDTFLMVVPGQLRAAAACSRLLAELPPVPTSLVVRGPLRDGVDGHVVSAAVGAPCQGVFPALRGIAAATEAGRLAEAARDRRVRRLAAAILGRIVPAGDAVARGSVR
jgi:secretion/DNA translocation related CpaE-like protein